MNNEKELTNKKGITKVSAKGDALTEKKVSISDAIKSKLASIDTEAKMKQSEKKSSSIWNLDKIRNAERFKDIKHSSDSTVRNAVRKVQERVCNAILHNAKNSLQDALNKNFIELKDLNSYLHDANNFSNRKRSNFADLQLAYEIHSEAK